MSVASLSNAYVVAARRSAIGRIGGLHKNRRIEDLAVPVLQAALADCGLEAERVDEIIIGNASHGSNPGRLIALAAGLPETVSAQTIDRQCASGLDAILSGMRLVGLGEADVVVAGGVEALSTAPWRVAKPRNLYQLPRFVAAEPVATYADDEPQLFEASEALASRLGIGRDQQDMIALKSYLKAAEARKDNRFVGEIVPIRSEVEEARDQSAHEPSIEELTDLPTFLAPDGTMTTGNTSTMHDGAAFAVIVNETIYEELGRPGALRLVASATRGVSPIEEANAPVAAMQSLYGKLNGFAREDVKVVEISESSAAQVIALRDGLGLDEDIINPDGGAVARGHPFAASGAVLVARLFTRMARNGKSEGERPRYGVATQGAIGGLGLAALFESV